MKIYITPNLFAFLVIVLVGAYVAWCGNIWLARFDAMLAAFNFWMYLNQLERMRKMRSDV